LESNIAKKPGLFFGSEAGDLSAFTGDGDAAGTLATGLGATLGLDTDFFGATGVGAGLAVEGVAVLGALAVVTAVVAVFLRGSELGAGSSLGKITVGEGVRGVSGFFTGHSGTSGPESRGTGEGGGSVPGAPVSFITGAGVLGLAALPGTAVSGLSVLGESFVTGIGGGGMRRLVGSGTNSGAAGASGFPVSGCCAEPSQSAAR